MKISLFCFTLLFATTAVPAVDKTATSTPAAIPWNQIGAKAGANYQGNGLAVTPTASGAQLHCVFQRLDGEATPEGLWLTSTVTNTPTDRFRVTAIEISRKATSVPPLPKGPRCAKRTTLLGKPSRGGLGKPLGRGEGENDPRISGDASTDNEMIRLSATGNVTIDAQTVRFTRPGLTEEYTVSMDGLRQDFIVEQAPPPPSPLNGDHVARSAQPISGNNLVAGLGSHWEGVRGEKVPMRHQIHNELILTLSITGATVESAPGGARLILANSGRKIAYTRLRVTDATGKELPARIEVLPVEDEVTSLKSSNLFGDNFQEMNPFTSEAVDSKLSIIINDTAAIYPLRIDPTFSDANWSSLGVIPGANIPVSAAVVDGSGNLYIGGGFTVVGNVNANQVAEWNGSSWLALGSGINQDGVVITLATSCSTLYVGGVFTNAGGTAATNIAQWDGTNWSALGPGLNSLVLALAVSGDTLYAGGIFTATGDNSITATNIAQWNGTSWSALGSGLYSSSIPGGAQVQALTVSGGTLYAGGTFDTAGGVPAADIAQWDGTSWSALGSGISGMGADQGGPWVNALAASGGILYVGGDFSAAGGSPAASIAQWDGTSWSPLGSGISGVGLDQSGPFVNALAASGGILYVGGNFGVAGGSPAASIAQWDGTSWSALGSGVAGLAPFTSSVNALAVSGGNLFAAGSFDLLGGTPAACVGQWNGTSWSALFSGTPGVDSQISALVVSGSTLYAGGYFTMAGAANSVAQWNGSAWSALGSGLNNLVYALAVSGGTLYAGGLFTATGDNSVTVNYIAQWDGTNWSALGSGMDSPVDSLAISSGTLYAGGEFANAGGVAATNIAQWDGTSWSALGSGMDQYGYVRALAVSGGTLYAGGYFTNAGGTAANGIAQWNGSAWSALGSGMNQYGEVLALAASGSTLYAGGYFTSAGGTAATNIAQWNGSSWSAPGSGLNDIVFALAPSGSNLYVGGYFTATGDNSVTANRIAQWNGSAWLPLGSGVGGANPGVYALALSGGSLYAGGAFTTAGTNVCAYAAVASLAGTPLVIITTNAAFGFTNGIFGFDICGPSGSNVIIQASTNLQTWIPLQTNSLGSGLLYFSDAQSPNNQQRFYRAELSP